jgi:hypothetical protein
LAADRLDGRPAHPPRALFGDGTPAHGGVRLAVTRGQPGPAGEAVGPAKRCTSPISATNTAPSTSPTPGWAGGCGRRCGPAQPARRIAGTGLRPRGRVPFPVARRRQRVHGENLAAGRHQRPHEQAPVRSRSQWSQ